MDVSVMKAAFTMSRTDMEAALRMLATNSIDGVNKESTEAQERDDEIRILKDRLRQADDYIRFSEDSYRGVKRNYRELSLENYELTIENRRLKDQIRALDSAMTTPQEPRSGQILPVQAHQPPTLDSWQAPRSGQQSVLATPIFRPRSTDRDSDSRPIKRVRFDLGSTSPRRSCSPPRGRRMERDPFGLGNASSRRNDRN